MIFVVKSSLSKLDLHFYSFTVFSVNTLSKIFLNFLRSRFLHSIFGIMERKIFTTVKIKTKPHIKHYLETQFGSPCNIPSGHFVSEYLNVLLSRPVKFDNCKTVPEKETITIIINEKSFKRYGYGLTQTNRRNFNLVIDNFIKSLIRSITENILYNNSINEDWKKNYETLKKEHKQLLVLSELPTSSETLKNYRKFENVINKRLKEHKQNRIKEKNALMQAAYVCLGFDETMISLDALLKDFYRYRKAQNL